MAFTKSLNYKQLDIAFFYFTTSSNKHMLLLKNNRLQDLVKSFILLWILFLANSTFL